MRVQYRITQTKLDKAKSLIRSNGGDFSGGEFSVKGVEGRYSITDENLLTVVVDSKPFLASWSLIESKLDGFFQ